MNPKEMAEWVRERGHMNNEGQEQRRIIAKFLDNLPPVLEGFEMTGEIREPDEDEWFLNDAGVVDRQGEGGYTFNTRLILHKIEPDLSFFPGDLTANKKGIIGIVNNDGTTSPLCITESRYEPHFGDIHMASNEEVIEYTRRNYNLVAFAAMSMAKIVKEWEKVKEAKENNEE